MPIKQIYIIALGLPFPVKVLYTAPSYFLFYPS